MGRKEALFSAEVFIWGGKKWVSPSFLLLFEELQTSEDCFESPSWAVPTWPVVLDPFILWLGPLWRFAWLRSCHILLVAIYRLEPTRKQLLEVTGPWEWPWQDVPCLDRGTWTPLESGCPDFLSSSSADLAVSFLWGDGSWLLTSSATCGPARPLASSWASATCAVWPVLPPPDGKPEETVGRSQAGVSPSKWNFV